MRMSICGPVLRFGAAGAGMNGEQGVPRVVGAAEHGPQLKDFNGPLEAIGFRRQLGRHVGVGLGVQHFGQAARIGDALAQVLRRRDPVLELLDLLYYAARPLGAGPERRVRLKRLELAQPRPLASDVKESLAVR